MWLTPYVAFGVDIPHQLVNTDVAYAYKTTSSEGYSRIPIGRFFTSLFCLNSDMIVGFFVLFFACARTRVCGFPLMNRFVQGLYNLLKSKTCLFCATAYAEVTTKYLRVGVASFD